MEARRTVKDRYKTIKGPSKTVKDRRTTAKDRRKTVKDRQRPSKTVERLSKTVNSVVFSFPLFGSKRLRMEGIHIGGDPHRLQRRGEGIRTGNPPTCVAGVRLVGVFLPFTSSNLLPPFNSLSRGAQLEVPSLPPLPPPLLLQTDRHSGPGPSARFSFGSSP